MNSPDASGMCVFEASSRVGGRTYSVPPSVLGNEFTLDVGAYRFSPDMHLPGDLILHDLKLPTACYEPGCPSAKDDFVPPFIFNYTAPLRRIVDATTGLPSGYVTALHTMVDKMKALGVRVYLSTPLLDITPAASPGGMQLLHFAAGTVTATGAVLLNLPRNKLLLLPSVAKTVSPRTLAMLQCAQFDSPPDLFGNRSMMSSTGLTKAYYYYDDAWWWTKINTTVGEYPANAFHPVETSSDIFIGVHWNDGPVVCTDALTGRSVKPTRAWLASQGAAAAKSCHGYLEAYYAATNETFFYGVTGAPNEPFGMVQGTEPSSAAVLEKAHAALLEAIAPVLAKKGVAPTSLPLPSALVVGAWSHPTVIANDTGYTAPTKVYWDAGMSGSPAGACGVDGLDDDEYRTTVLQPFGRDTNVFLANNDWLSMNVRYFEGDWAQETLVQSERALFRLGLSMPLWLNQTYYDEKIVKLA